MSTMHMFTVNHTHTLERLLHLKHLIERLKAMNRHATLTEQERYAVRECLDHAYDRATAILADMGQSRPGLIPVCLVASIAITIINDHLFIEEETQP